MMLNLRFRSKDIKEFEKAHNKSIYELIDDNSIEGIINLIKMGVGCDDDKAHDILDAELEKDGVDTTTVFFDILSSLQRYGFLPKQLNLLIMKELMIKEMEKMNSQIVENGLTIVKE